MADYIYGKYNRGRSEFSLSSFANGHRYKEAWQDRKEIFHTPDGTFQRTQEGIPGGIMRCIGLRRRIITTRRMMIIS